jgi:hypothetical protein
MRAEIRQLITPTMLLAAVLVLARPAPASGGLGRYGAHTNQEDQVAHSNQERSVPGDPLDAARPPWPDDLPSGAVVVLGSAAPPDAGAEGTLAAPWAGIGIDASGPGGAVGAGGGQGAIVPAPGGLLLVGLAVVTARRRRRRVPRP